MPFVTGPLPQRLKLVHGFGAVAFGVKDQGFSYLLLIFYNQVIGLPAHLVGLVIMIAMVSVSYTHLTLPTSDLV